MIITFNEALAVVKAIKPVLDHAHCDASTRESLAAARLMDALKIITECQEYAESSGEYAGHLGIPQGHAFEEEDAEDTTIRIQDHVEPDAFGD